MRSAYNTVASFVLAGVLSLLISGCAAPGAWPTREGFVRPAGIYVIHLPGIMGPIPHDHDFAYGLLVSGAQDVQLFDWTHPLPLVNLMNEKWQAAQSKGLQRRIAELRSENPLARIVITAHSGGCHVALNAIESLPREAGPVEQLWMIAPAVSPDYDLTTALDRVVRIVAITSEEDWIILGLGTSWFGAADRFRGDAAGRIGFHFEHPRFEQWLYHPGWRRLGYNGDHVRAMDHRFVIETIGPSMMGWIPIGPGFDYDKFAPALSTGSQPPIDQ